MVLWIFGYGSLIWTPDFQYEERVTGYVKDFKRVFAPAGPADFLSEDTGGKDGMRLTLEPHEGAMTGGVAYRVTADVERQIVSLYLQESMSTPGACKVLMLPFFTSEKGSDPPATLLVLTYLAPPERSNLWHIVLQLSSTPTASDQTHRMMSGGNDGRRRVSRQDQWKRDRAWFEAQYNRATSSQ